MKKNLATAMAAAMAFGAVVPAFANEIQTTAVVETTTGTIDTALAEGKRVKVANYDEVYDTKFTEDKKDDTLKTGVTILNTITKGEKYLISVPYTAEELKNPTLDNSIKQAKKNLDDTIAEIKLLMTYTYKDNGVTKKLYTLTKNENKATASDTKNSIEVVLTSAKPSEGANKSYTFDNIKFDEVAEENVIEKVLDIEYYAEKDYKLLSKYVYELEQASKKITVKTREVNARTLALDVYKNDAKKTHVATIMIEGYNKFDADEFVRIPGNSDFANHWAEETIFNAMYAGAVDVSSKFRPEDSITRAEFIKIVNKSFGLKTKASGEKFSDVNDKQWFYNDVLIALEAGYVDGYDDGTFRPDAKITKQEAAKIVASVIDSKKALDKYVDTTATANPDGKVEVIVNDANGKPVHLDSETKFKDDNKIEAWADESVIALSHNSVNVITGYKGYFNPANSITRAEALTMMEKGAEFVK